MVRDMSNNNNTNNNAIESEEVMDLRRGPWTIDEDLALINYITNHGEGRWNSLARSAGLKRTGKSCRLRWLNYLRPDVRRGNITLEEQLLILELHNRWGNRWSKIAQYLPGRTDNEIKNYWRTRVQKHAKQLKCDVNSKQFKDTMRYLWMPRLVERIQAAAAATASSSATTAAPTTTTINSSSPTLSISTNDTTNNNTCYNNNNLNNNNFEVHNGKMVLAEENYPVMKYDSIGSQSYYNNTPENSGTTPASSSDTFGTPISDLSSDYLGVPINGNNNPNNIPQDYYYQLPSQVNYSNCSITSSQSCLFPLGMDYFNTMEPNTPWIRSGDTSDNFWNNVDNNIMFLQHQLMNDNM